MDKSVVYLYFWYIDLKMAYEVEGISNVYLSYYNPRMMLKTMANFFFQKVKVVTIDKLNTRFNNEYVVDRYSCQL